jgi:hypothetical protein
MVRNTIILELLLEAIPNYATYTFNTVSLFGGKIKKA